MSSEHTDRLTYKGRPLTTLGNPVQVGDAAPAFTLLDNRMQPVSSADSAGRVRLISVVPSLDTGICHAQTKRFNDEARNFPGVVFLTVSAEHPWNQRRWVQQESCSDITVVSDVADLAFGQAYGLAIKELRLLQRAVFVIDADGRVAYAEYVPEIAQFPNYDAALAALAAA